MFQTKASIKKASIKDVAVKTRTRPMAEAGVLREVKQERLG